MKRAAPNQAHRVGNTFNRAEVDAAMQLFAMLRRGGDVRQMLRAEPLQSIERKFRTMQQTQKRAAAGDAQEGSAA